MQAKETFKVIQILVIGDRGIGKTSLIYRYTDKYFLTDLKQDSGLFMKSKEIKHNGRLLILNIWDFGRLNIEAIQPNFLRSMNGIVVSFDITSIRSFDVAKNAYHSLKNNYPDLEYKFVGLKGDLRDERTVMQEEIDAFIAEVNITYFEVSAKENTNVNESFMRLATRVANSEALRNLRTFTISEADLPRTEASQQRKCC